jgi:DNA-binding NarL/FixJ family response regulator
LERTRILLAEMPRMLCDIIKETVNRHPDMEVVGEQPDRASLISVARATEADVVVVGLSDLELPADCAALLEAVPEIRLLGVAPDGRRAFLWRADLGARPTRTSLGEISPLGLVHAIRTAVQVRS